MDINFKLYHYEKVLLCYFKHLSDSELSEKIVMLYLLQDLLPQDTLYKKLELMYTKMNR